MDIDTKTKPEEIEVFKFIADFTGSKLFELKPESRLSADLGVDGDDGDDFITAFVDKFNLDYSGFDLARHFNDEGVDFFGITYILRRALRYRSKTKSRIDLTVQDLIDWVERGYWLPYPDEKLIDA